MKRYLYKLIVDNGGAPCIQNGLLSLAICKPRIREHAKKNDWIFGFAGKALDATHSNNRLIYVAQVSQIVRGDEYYRSNGEYGNRPDCIYQYSRGSYRPRKDARYHKKGVALTHDLGSVEDGYSRATVLLSERYRYFHKNGPEPAANSEIRQLLKNLSQGHRVNLSDHLLNELDQMTSLAFDANSVEFPYEQFDHHSETCLKCDGECDEGIATDNCDFTCEPPSSC